VGSYKLSPTAVEISMKLWVELWRSWDYIFSLKLCGDYGFPAMYRCSSMRRASILFAQAEVFDNMASVFLKFRPKNDALGLTLLIAAVCLFAGAVGFARVLIPQETAFYAMA
jgi:hypothetical protein